MPACAGLSKNPSSSLKSPKSLTSLKVHINQQDSRIDLFDNVYFGSLEHVGVV